MKDDTILNKVQKGILSKESKVQQMTLQLVRCCQLVDFQIGSSATRGVCNCEVVFQIVEFQSLYKQRLVPFLLPRTVVHINVIPHSPRTPKTNTPIYLYPIDHPSRSVLALYTYIHTYISSKANKRKTNAKLW